jgi:hypothetical protein
MRSMLKAPGTKCLKLYNVESPSRVAFRFNLRHYIVASLAAAVAWPVTLLNSASFLDSPWTLVEARAREAGQVHWYTRSKQSDDECVRVHWYTMSKQSGDEWPGPTWRLGNSWRRRWWRGAQGGRA